MKKLIRKVKTATNTNISDINNQHQQTTTVDDLIGQLRETGSRYPDGRSVDQSRPASLQLGVITSSDSSAMAKYGGACVVASIKAELLPDPTDLMVVKQGSKKKSQSGVDQNNGGMMTTTTTTTKTNVNNCNIDDDDDNNTKSMFDKGLLIRLTIDNAISDIDSSTTTTTTSAAESSQLSQLQSFLNQLLLNEIIDFDDLLVSMMTSSPSSQPSPVVCEMEIDDVIIENGTTDDTDEDGGRSHPPKYYWVLYCDLMIIYKDGEPMGACLLALMAALKSLQLPGLETIFEESKKEGVNENDQKDVEGSAPKMKICADYGRLNRLRLRSFPFACTYANFGTSQMTSSSRDASSSSLIILVDPSEMELAACQRNYLTLIFDISRQQQNWGKDPQILGIYKSICSRGATTDVDFFTGCMSLNATKICYQNEKLFEEAVAVARQQESL